MERSVSSRFLRDLARSVEEKVGTVTEADVFTGLAAAEVPMADHVSGPRVLSDRAAGAWRYPVSTGRPSHASAP